MAYASAMELDVERKFEVYDLHWTIEHFSLVTLSERWSVLSPEFTVSGSQVTRWQMGLGPASGPGLQPDCVAFRLFRCDDGGGPDTILAEWRLEVSASRYGGEVVVDGRSEFAPGDEHRQDLQDVKSSMVRSMDADHAILRCKMIVTVPCEEEDSDDEDVRPLDEGKRRLSDDLFDMFSEGYECDLMLKLRNDGTVMAHKAILCARIDGLQHMLDGGGYAGTEVVSGRTVDVVDLTYLDEKALRSILEYAYSGDIRRLLSFPCLALLEVSAELDIYHLRRVFAAKELCFRTALRVRETRITWVASEFLDDCQSMSSPFLPDDDGGTTWRLHILPGEGRHRDHFAVYLEGETGSACAEFTVSDELGQRLHSRRVRSARPLRIERFVLRAFLRNLLAGAPLRLAVRLRRPAGPPESYLERRELSVVSNVPCTGSLDLLSRTMHDLLDLPDFSDVRLRCDDGSSLPAHRSLVGFRCDRLRNLLNDAEEGSDSVSVGDLSQHVLYLLLSYLYRGVLVGTEDRREVARLRDAASAFRLSMLVSMCEEVLARRDS